MTGEGHRAHLNVTTSPGPWQHHPSTPETFIGLGGVLALDFRDRPSVTLRPGMAFSVPAGISHRLASARAVSISLEAEDQQVVFEPPED